MAEVRDGEINFVDYIRVIIKRRWLIVGGTLVCILAAFAYNKWFRAPEMQIYEAKASLLITPPAVKSEFLPNFSITVYQVLAKAQDLTDSLIVRLHRNHSVEQDLSVNALNDALKTQVSSPEGSMPILLDFLVTSSDTSSMHPVAVANTWAEVFVEKNRGISSREVTGSYEQIKLQFDLAQKNLRSLEDSLSVFDRRNRTDALSIELDAKRKKFEERQTAFLNAQIEMRSLIQARQELDIFLKVMETSKGKWIGDLDVLENRFPLLASNNDESLKRIYSSVIQTRDRLRQLQEAVQRYQNENSLTLLTQEVAEKQKLLFLYKSELSQTGIDAAVIEKVIKQIEGKKDVGSTSPVVSTTTGQSMRELISLQLGINLFQPRQEQLLVEIENLQTEIGQLQKDLSEKQKRQKYLDMELEPLQQIYQTMSEQYLTKKRQKVDLDLAIQTLQPQIAYYKSEADRLRTETRQLNDFLADINTLRSRMTGNMASYQATVTRFTQLLEDARIAKAGQPEDVRIVARAVTPRPLPRETATQTTGLAGVVGLLMSIFLAFCLEYWEKAKQQL